MPAMREAARPISVFFRMMNVPRGCVRRVELGTIRRRVGMWPHSGAADVRSGNAPPPLVRFWR